MVGSEKIANHFANKYSDLYNKCVLGREFHQLKSSIQDNISDDDLIEDVDKVTPELVKEALKKIKATKSDLLFDFNSDCLINAPEVLLNHPAIMFRTFLIHGKVALILLLCSLVKGQFR